MPWRQLDSSYIYQSSLSLTTVRCSSRNHFICLVILMQPVEALSVYSNRFKMSLRVGFIGVENYAYLR